MSSPNMSAMNAIQNIFLSLCLRRGLVLDLVTARFVRSFSTSRFTLSRTSSIRLKEKVRFIKPANLSDYRLCLVLV
jgi:hypothetical protein